MMEHQLKQSVMLIGIVGALFGCGNNESNHLNQRDSGQAYISKEGLINCFEPNLTVNGLVLWCEASAILYDGKEITIANDKNMPDERTAVFRLPFNRYFIDPAAQPVYSTNKWLKASEKYEDFALTPDGKYAFLTTAFIRSIDNFNVILYWEVGDEENPHVISKNGTDSTSTSYRADISRALASAEFPQGPPYFKIEALAVTEEMLYLGVREEGKTSKDFKYKIKILAAPYQIKDKKIVLINDFKVRCDIDPATIKPGSEEIGLSSLEYDPFNDRFLILTSFEREGKLGGYIWIATQKALDANSMTLIEDSTGRPLEFQHKCEDVAIINKNKVIVIHDDDRESIPVAGQVRQPYQAAYSIVEFRR